MRNSVDLTPWGVILFKEFSEPIVAALEQIETDYSNRKTSLLNSICSFNFLVSVCVSSKLSYHLSEYLQNKNIDLVNALNRVNQVTVLIQILRDNAAVKFDEFMMISIA